MPRSELSRFRFGSSPTKTMNRAVKVMVLQITTKTLFGLTGSSSGSSSSKIFRIVVLVVAVMVQQEQKSNLLLTVQSSSMHNMPPRNVILRRPTTRSSKQLFVEELTSNIEVVELLPAQNTPSPNLQQSQSISKASDDDTTINEGNDESTIQGSDSTVGSSSIRRGRRVTTGRSFEKAILENDKKLLEIEFPEGFKKLCRFTKHLANDLMEGYKAIELSSEDQSSGRSLWAQCQDVADMKFTYETDFGGRDKLWITKWTLVIKTDISGDLWSSLLVLGSGIGVSCTLSSEYKSFTLRLPCIRRPSLFNRLQVWTALRQLSAWTNKAEFLLASLLLLTLLTSGVSRLNPRTALFRTVPKHNPFSRNISAPFNVQLCRIETELLQ
ncbi:Callose synthase 3 [Platanthera guangdongensis]|uniref:Callose synthase 3 n=1 Tax=Platanthera guangdongensis TaxID=2320717 RepID=A0ABR2M3B0_9ASPA